MGWKQSVNDYFSFTRKDRIAILILILLITGVFFLPNFFSHKAGPKPATTDTSWITSLKKLEQKEEEDSDPGDKNRDDNSSAYQYDRSAGNYPGRTKGELFYFDPNTLPANGWKRLGLRDKTVRTIQNYLDKGGKFRKPEDLQKIYGLFPDEYERIAPYIRIVSPEIKSDKEYSSNDLNEKPPVKTYTTVNSVIEINTADTTALIALPGIGSKLATRIIHFRDKLGGFYSISQVGETFGLPDSTFQKIRQYLKLDNTAIRKININTTTTDELKTHPYIRYSIANPIVAYRNQHGPFIKVEDIKKVMVVTEEIYNKIYPYLAVQ